MSAVTGWICTPIQPRSTSPLSLSWATTVLTVLAGMAKPMPTDPPDGEKIAVLTPMTLAVDVEGRPAGVALVDRRIDLDVIVVRTVADIAAAGRHDACRYGTAETERIADRDHPVADARRTVGERDEGKSCRPSTLISARSVFGSVPTTLAG